MADMAYRDVHAMNPIEARKRLIRTYQDTGSISETARRWHTSRLVVRRRVQRYTAEGKNGLKDRSRRLRNSPLRTPASIEQKVKAARTATRHGRVRLAVYLETQELSIYPHTIRHILRRQDPIRGTR